MKSTEKLKPMIVSLFWKKSYKTLDPAKISYINEAILIDNLYRNLIAYDNYGNIVSDLADSFFWDGKSYVFQFRGEKLTSKGIPITAEDALLSLKRLMLIDGNSHGRLKKYICGGENLNNINDICSGLYVLEGSLYITPNESISHDLLLNLFTGIDFKILSKNSFELEQPYKIKDYTNTTGAYYIDDFSDEIEPIFLINKNYEDANSKSPQVWKIKSSELSEKISKLGVDVDLITTASIIDWESGNVDKSKYTIFETLPIAIELLVFTKVGQSSFSLSERAYVGNVIRNFLKNKIEINKQETYQFFPEDSVGYIAKKDEERLSSILLNRDRPDKIIKVGFPKSIISVLGDYKSLLAFNIEVCEYELSQYSVESREVDAMYILTDTSVQEELTLLEYNFNFGIFGLDSNESTKWLKSYVILERAERIRTLKEFHMKVLSELKIIPLYAMPYYAIATKNKTFLMSKQSASTKIWKIQTNSSIY